MAVAGGTRFPINCTGRQICRQAVIDSLCYWDFLVDAAGKREQTRERKILMDSGKSVLDPLLAETRPGKACRLWRRYAALRGANLPSVEPTAHTCGALSRTSIRFVDRCTKIINGNFQFTVDSCSLLKETL